MKKFLLSIGLILFLPSNNNAHVAHYSKYNYLEYELFRNNQSIGYHKYDFVRDKDAIASSLLICEILNEVKEKNKSFLNTI